MTSGIYELKFKYGGNYIGKSIDVENRWKQHQEKLDKGTGAKALQEAYSASGCTFEANLIYECHPDHLDIMEECLIARMNPTLNTTRPKDRLEGIAGEDFVNIISKFHLSTVDHIRFLQHSENQLNNALLALSNCEEKIEVLQKQRSDEELKADTVDRIEELSAEVDDLNESLDEAEESITKLTEYINKLKSELEYARLPWWKKLFK